MPRPANDVAALVADLKSRLDRLAATARADGRTVALAQLQSLLGGGVVRRGPGRPKGSRNKPNAAAVAKPKQKRKNSWAGLSPAARLKRVNAIRKGKGLPPRGE